MQGIDEALLRVMRGWGETLPALWATARALTELGGATWLIPLTLAVCAIMAFQGFRRCAWSLALITFGGRLAVELMKWGIDRARPAFSGAEITVHSQSFPSGHAANSMIVYLGIALIALPARRWPVPTAIILSLVIGVTRPTLGVHWPSDVLAGWALGVAWTLSAVWLLRPWIEGRSEDRPSSA